MLLALVVIGMGAWNHFRLVPRVSEALPVAAGGAGPTIEDAPVADTAGEGGAQPVEVRTGLAWLRLRRAVRVEVGGLVAVLAVTGVLQNERPAAEAVGIGGNFQVTVPLTDEVAARKVELLGAHHPSQHAKPWYDAELFRAHLRLRGVQAKARWAKGFAAETVVMDVS